MARTQIKLTQADEDFISKIVYNLAQNMEWELPKLVPGINKIANTKHIIKNKYSVTKEDHLLICDNAATKDDITLTLPPVLKTDFYIIKSKACHKVIVSGGGTTINGKPSVSMQRRYGSLHIVGDTAEWYTI